MSQDIINVTDTDFEKEVLQSDLPVLVDFWAAWCGPCQMVAPVLESISRNHKGRIVIAKLNVDENREIPMKYGVMSIPTMILFKEGDVKETVIGAVPQDEIEKTIMKHL